LPKHSHNPNYFSLIFDAIPGLVPLRARDPGRVPSTIGGVAFRLRPFEKADFDTLWRIDQACFDPQLAYSRPELAFYMRRPGSFTFVAEEPGGDLANHEAGRILGFIVAETRRKIGHIITIDVVAEGRRSGVGSLLLDAAEKRLIRDGVATVALETPVNNEAAIRFYKKKGYFVEKTVAGYYSGQLDALVMSKELMAFEASGLETKK
jgi:[ribosomal protein S18]-alanine N-acetyltransferase